MGDKFLNTDNLQIFTKKSNSLTKKDLKSKANQLNNYLEDIKDDFKDVIVSKEGSDALKASYANAIKNSEQSPNEELNDIENDEPISQEERKKQYAEFVYKVQNIHFGRVVQQLNPAQIEIIENNLAWALGEKGEKIENPGHPEYTKGINADVVGITTPEEANEFWKTVLDGNCTRPPYATGQDSDGKPYECQIIELKEDTKFVRVFVKNGNKYGQWMMRAEDIEGLTPEEIKEKFALPNLPDSVCDVTLPAGTRLRVGIAGENKDWGKGGGIQYELMGLRLGEFDNDRPLPKVKK